MIYQQNKVKVQLQHWTLLLFIHQSISVCCQEENLVECDSQLQLVKLHKTDWTFPSHLVHQSSRGTYEQLMCEQAPSLVHYLWFHNALPPQVCWVRWAITNGRIQNQTLSDVVGKALSPVGYDHVALTSLHCWVLRLQWLHMALWCKRMKVNVIAPMSTSSLKATSGFTSEWNSDH